MMHKQTRSCLQAGAVLLFLLILTACSQDNTIPLNLDNAQTAAATRREGIVKPAAENIYHLFEGRQAQTIDMTSLAIRPSFHAFITYEEAIYDTMVLFEILQQVYAAYLYFGGDDVFIPVLEELIEMFSTRDMWAIGLFEMALIRALDPILNDAHLWIAGPDFGNMYGFFQVIQRDRIHFARSENGFFNPDTGQYVTEIQLYEQTFQPEEVFRLSLTNDGQFYYAPVIKLQDAPARVNGTIIYTSGDESLLPFEAASQNPRRMQAPSLTRENGIPVITIRAMGSPHMPPLSPGQISSYHCPSYARQFLYFADQLQDEPVIIVDVRSNPGGDGILGSMWLHRLLGEIVPTNFFAIMTYSEVPCAACDNEDINPYITQEEMYELEQHAINAHETYRYPTSLDERHSITFSSPRRIVQSNQMIILLTDRFTGSAPERFADQVLNVENSLIIGQHTAGVFKTTTHPGSFFLPYSGIAMGGIASGVFITPDGHLPEGIGLAPDIWTSGDALEAALAMVERYLR